jgi:hypothetical protein
MHPNEIQLSALNLSSDAESGDVGRAIGFLPPRQHRMPVRRVVDHRSVLYAWPSPSQHHPLPPRSGSAA